MATGKRYYWIKLTDKFMTSDTVDFLMSQENGANYVVLYQMLCLKTMNTGGRLCRHLGEMIIPYDAQKIQRDCKYFSLDTVRVALELYRKLGLVYESEDGVLTLTNHHELVGSESDYAAQKRRQRINGEQKALPKGGHGVDSGVEIVHTDKEIRDRDRDKEIDKDIDIDKDINNKTLEENLCQSESDLSASDKADCCTPAEMQRVVKAWNDLGLQKVIKLTAASNRGRMLHARIKEYGFDTVLSTIQSIKDCPFLMGQNKMGWMPDFAWVIKPNNFIKVLEGNYADRAPGARPNPAAEQKKKERKPDLVEYPLHSGRMIPREQANREVSVTDMVEFPPGTGMLMPPWEAERNRQRGKG